LYLLFDSGKNRNRSKHVSGVGVLTVKETGKDSGARNIRIDIITLHLERDNIKVFTGFCKTPRE